MSLKQFLSSRAFRDNLLLSAVILVFLNFFIFWSLKIYTRHGQEKTVPDFQGMSFEQARHAARINDLKVKIIDSLYREESHPGAVIMQVPPSGFKVKKNRTVLLTVNSAIPENVTVPKLTDISFRQAQALIENCGLVLGKVTYQPSEFDNLVLEVYSGSDRVSPGDKLFKGSRVDVTVGRSSGGYLVQVPLLTGLSLAEATPLLTGAMLNTGVIIYDETIVSREDSSSLLIWRQRPDPVEVSHIERGSSVDLWVTNDSLKIDQETIREIQ